MTTPITIAYGNGVGPGIAEAVLYILREAAAPITIEAIEIGERVYAMGEKTGILPYAWDNLIRTRILLKGPTSSPKQDDFLPVDAVIRDAFELEISHQSTHSAEDYPDITAHAHINEHFALFEPAHDTMTNIAGGNSANPSSMLLAALAMLEHIGEGDTAHLIRTAWQQTLRDGQVTADIYQWRKGLKKLSTQQFAEAIAERMGKTPSRSTAASV